MTVRQLARISNDFAPSERAIPLEALLSTAEVASLLGLDPRTIRTRARRMRIGRWWGSGNHAYWTQQQVERLRGSAGSP